MLMPLNQASIFIFVSKVLTFPFLWFVQLMETSGTIMNDSDVRAPISPLHLAVRTLQTLEIEGLW